MSVMHTFRRLLDHYGIYLLLAAWALFILTLAGLSTEIKAYRRATEAQKSLATAVEIKAETTESPVALAEYRQIKELVEQLHPSLTVEMTGTDLVIKTSRIADFSEWRLGVHDAILAKPDWRWKILRLCAGACPGSTFEIQLQASRIALEVTAR